MGYVAGVPYAGGEYGGIDSVSPYSGALVLGAAHRPGRIPRRPAQGSGYSMTLFYSSNVWTYSEGSDVQQPSYVKAELNTQFSAGLGWNLSFGRLPEAERPAQHYEQFVWLGPAGWSHKFFRAPHGRPKGPDGTSPATVSRGTEAT